MLTRILCSSDVINMAIKLSTAIVLFKIRLKYVVNADNLFNFHKVRNIFQIHEVYIYLSAFRLASVFSDVV